MFWQKMQSNFHRLPELPFAFPSSLPSLTLCLLCLSRLERDCPLLVAPLHFELHVNWCRCRCPCRHRWRLCPDGQQAVYSSLALSLSLVSSGSINSSSLSPAHPLSLCLSLSCCHCWHSQVFYHICKCEFYARREQNTSYTPYIYRICWYYLHKWWTSWLPY